MITKFILFQASFGNEDETLRHKDICTQEQHTYASDFACELGRRLIEKGFGIILNGAAELDADIGNAAVQACVALGIESRERIRTYPYGYKSMKGFGRVIRRTGKRWMDARTFVVNNCDAVIAISGGKGTSDAIQKALLARKPVFPVAIVSGASRDEWDKLVNQGYYNKFFGDMDFLGDVSLTPADLAQEIVSACNLLLYPTTPKYSDRVFIVHGHNDSSKLELEQILEKLKLKPIILHKQPDMGQTIFEKLQHELSDVGFAFILLTPDDICESASTSESASIPTIKRARARQNVVFEHGLLLGLLGPKRVCAIVKGDIEIPSDLHGLMCKKVSTGEALSSIVLAIVGELKAAGYPVDANDLLVHEGPRITP
jgi:predicted nucleotide-binding protein